MNYNVRRSAILIAWLIVLVSFAPIAQCQRLEESAFKTPPPAARPWVYWFWNNGNVTKAGITADLEAMQRVGIGGVILMDIVERFAPPAGTADFMNPEWQDLFRFSVAEAHRLGLEINMSNAPGWCGSSGPWITPELSMQKLVKSAILVQGPKSFAGNLPQPDLGLTRRRDGLEGSVKYPDYYQDIAVLAFEQTASGSVPASAVVNLTSKLNADGQLSWDVPAGNWVIQRIGHTTTGASTSPPVKGGNGLECDKLSSHAMDVQFENLIQKLVGQVGALAGPTLSATHIDSWEVGVQNWTPDFVQEFKTRRGYDPTPYLPDITGVTIAAAGEAAPKDAHVSIGDAATATRFRWDFNNTISELLAQNYVGRLAQLAHENHMRLSIEGYDLPFGDEATYTAGADEPMTEFWATGGNQNATKGRQMASVAHVMGRTVVGAEAFTSGDNEQWKMHPATVKALGDYEFAEGVNRFVVHRYAHQPYVDRVPGVTMGPWGLHYERTQTWWEMSTAWHEYLSRCQFMLRQGLFAADLCYLRPQLPDQTYFTPSPGVPAGYKYDECSSEALITRMKVRDGRLVLPDGMSYSLLMLPENSRLMTPALVGKIRDLVNDGATVLGPPPTGSPSLSGFPECDAVVKKTTDELWGNCDGTSITRHTFGKGKVIWGEPVEKVLREELHRQPDFTATAKLNWIHRTVDGAEVYFVASGSSVATETRCEFRVRGLQPEIWNPETGEIHRPAMFEQTASGVSIPLRFEPSGSTFVVFRSHPHEPDPIASFMRSDQPVISPTKAAAIQIQSARYGVLNDPQRTRDVLAKVKARADNAEVAFGVTEMADGDDPAHGAVKTLTVEYTLDGEPRTMTGQDPDQLSFAPPKAAIPRAAELRSDDAGAYRIEASEPGVYEIKTARGKTLSATVANVPEPVDLISKWTVEFPARWGAPLQLTLDHLMSLSESDVAGVRFFSGTATYRRGFTWNAAPNTEAWLNLGEVQVMADVKLNGKELGILWRTPYKVNVTSAIQPGHNVLEIRVANLWPNRMIGDTALPESQRFTWSSYLPFTKDSPLPRSGLIGPVSIESRVIVPAN